MGAGEGLELGLGVGEGVVWGCGGVGGDGPAAFEAFHFFAATRGMGGDEKLGLVIWVA